MGIHANRCRIYNYRCVRVQFKIGIIIYTGTGDDDYICPKFLKNGYSCHRGATASEYKRFSVADWIDNDDTLPEEKDEYHGDKK